MNHATSLAAGVLAVTALSACPVQAATADAPAPRQLAMVNLQGTSPYAGRLGYADLVIHPEATDVVVRVAPINGLTLPMHLYTYVYEGSCAGLGQRAAQANRRVIGYREPSGLWTVRNTIPLSADTLRGAPHALTVWSGPPDGNQMLYCGDMRIA